MKSTIALLPLAAVVGGLVGAWGPSEERRAYTERPKKAAEERAAKRGGFDPIAQFIKVPDAAKRPRRAKPPAEPAAKPPPAAAAEEEPAKAPPKAVPRRMLPPEDLQARIDEASELWRTRIKLARAAALERLGIAEGDAAAFDTSVDDMNARLRESIQTIADMLANEDSMTPEIGVRLMGDISVTLAETYDRLGECVDASMRGKVGELQLVEFIDPSVAEPLVAVKDKLDGRAFGRGKGN